MKTLIVPTDFSPVSVNAVNFATDLALDINASLLILNVFNIPLAYSDVPVALMSVEELQKSSENQLQTLKENLTHITSGKLKIYVESRLGNVTDELENVCRRIDPFAVVMGAKGTAGIENIFWGSNTIAVIRQLTWPVICVPPGKEYGKGIKKIGFATDLKQVVTTTPVSHIRQLVTGLKAELHVLNIDRNPEQPDPETSEQSLMLQQLISDLNPKYHFIRHEDVEDGIREFAETNNLDLVLIIPKKHKWMEQVLKPGNTKQIVFHSHIPVACIHEE